MTTGQTIARARQPWTDDELALLHTKQPARAIAMQTGRSVAAVQMQTSRRREEVGYRYPLACACGRKHYARRLCLKHYKQDLRRRLEGKDR